MHERGPSLAGTALIAGGAGFIGSHLCEALLRHGGTVICVDRFLTSTMTHIEHLIGHPRFRIEVHDVCHPLEQAPDWAGRLDRIYNLACPASPRYSQSDPVHTLMSSVLGTHNLLDLARTAGARYLQASTGDISGAGRDAFRPADPRACFEEGQRAAETLCCDARRQYGIDARIARIFNVYGPRMPLNDGRVVNDLIADALAGRDLVLPAIPGQTLSVCHVADLVRGLLLLMECPAAPDDPIELGSPDPISLHGLAREVRRLTGAVAEIAPTPALSQPGPSIPDLALARKLFDWSPTVPLTEGLKETVDYLASHINVVAHPRQAAALYRKQSQTRAPSS